METPFAEPKSAYNEGIFQIQRLNYLWVDAQNARKHGNLEAYRHNLDCIWDELSRDAARTDGGKIENFAEWNKTLSHFKEYQRLMHDMNLAKRLGKGYYYATLRETERFLRHLQDTAGKGGKYADPGEDKID
jgi:hypothetical protein